MQNLWNQADLQRSVNGQRSANDIPVELAELVYASRLLGSESSLVMHGGGNTSVKSELHDVIGYRVNVIFIKGSGVNLAGVDAHDFMPVRIEPLQKLQYLYATGGRSSEEDIEQFSTQRFKNFLYLNLFYLTDHMVNHSLSPSIETLLHAFLPHRFIFHTHSTALLTLSNQPNGEELCRQMLGDVFGLVPYIKPGLGLALACSAAVAYESAPSIKGLVLQKHGLVTFADTPDEAYDCMIESVTKLEERITRAGRKQFSSVQLPGTLASPKDVAPVIRRAVVEELVPCEHQYNQFVLDFRSTPDILAYVNSAKLAEVSAWGAMTPDFIIRTKNRPLVVSAPAADDLAGFRVAVQEAVDRYKAEHTAYFTRQQQASGLDVSMLDPLPRVVLVPGLGLFGLGRTSRAAAVNADIAQSTASAILDAESVGTFESITEREVFDIEYWEMEQAKMNKVRHDVFAGKVVMVTGAASGIGLATAKAFRQRGAELFMLDLNQDSLDRAAEELGGGVLSIACDVTDRNQVQSAFE